MTTPGPRTFREIVSVVICAWLGVLAIAVIVSVFPTAMTGAFGDKGPILGPLVLGAFAGSLSGLFLTNRRRRSAEYRSGWALAAGVPCAAAGVVVSALLADTLGSYALFAFPFVVGLTSYGGYRLASRVVANLSNATRVRG